jgi:hypothetical protein
METTQAVLSVCAAAATLAASSPPVLGQSSYANVKLEQ